MQAGIPAGATGVLGVAVLQGGERQGARRGGGG